MLPKNQKQKKEKKRKKKGGNGKKVGTYWCMLGSQLSFQSLFNCLKGLAYMLTENLGDQAVRIGTTCMMISFIEC